jgi:parallel beta-helix repeat protein
MKMRGKIVTGALAGCLILLGTWVPPAGGTVFTVACGGGGTPLQDAVDAACSGDTINVSGTCNEAVTIDMDAGPPTCGPNPAAPFTQLRIKAGGKGAGAAVVNGVGGPGITVTGNARNIQIEGFTVGSNTSHGIAVLGAHRVLLSSITTPSGVGTVDDGIHVDTASTRVQVLSSTLNGNGGDGLEMGATYGRVNNVTANDNGAAGFHLTGSQIDLQRCTAENTSSGNDQLYGFMTAGPGVITQSALAYGNLVAQFYDTASSTGVIHFRDVAGNSRATTPPTAADVQALPVGQGAPDEDCVTDGGDGLDTPAALGDDQIAGSVINTGANGICETTAAAGDDQKLTVGQGDPNQDCVTAGGDGLLQTAAVGDDVLAGGVINTGADGICDTMAIETAGFLEAGSGNRISSSAVTGNRGPGVYLLGDGNQLQRCSVSLNTGAQVLVEGNWNFIDGVSATRLSTSDFASTAPAFHVLSGSQYNYFRGNRASVAGTTVGDGYTIVNPDIPPGLVPDPTTTGERNTRRPTVTGDPPAALQ